MWNLWSSYLTLGQKKTSKVFCERDMQAFEGMSLITTIISLCFAVSVKSGRWNLKKKKTNSSWTDILSSSSVPRPHHDVFLLCLSFRYLSTSHSSVLGLRLTPFLWRAPCWECACVLAVQLLQSLTVGTGSKLAEAPSVVQLTRIFFFF